MARVPSFKTVSIGTPQVIDSYNQLAYIITSGNSNYITITNSIGEIMSFTSSGALGSDKGGGQIWAQVTVEAFGADAYLVINGDIAF